MTTQASPILKDRPFGVKRPINSSGYASSDLVCVVKCGNLQIGKVETLTEHINANNDTRTVRSTIK